MKLSKMNPEEFYQQVRSRNAAKLYEELARAIEAKRDFLYLVHGDTPEIRIIYERANQIANPLTCAYGILEAIEGLHLTVEEHMKSDPEICKLALDAAVSGIKQFRIRNSVAEAA